MISSVVPLAVGNALRLFVQPPTTARLWRILRKETNDFTGEADPGARKVYEGTEKSVCDWEFLNNGTTYYYRAYYWNGTTWTASATASGAPAATYEDASTDVPSIVRDRLEVGLAAEVARTKLYPESGSVQVLNAPPAWEDILWPLVTVHLQSENRYVSGIGEMTEAGGFDELTSEWKETEGWYAKVTLAVIGWSQNPDERTELRKALRRIIVANLGIFDAAGMAEIDFQQQDMEALGGEFPANVYQSMGTFTCMAPVRVVTSKSVPVADVTSTIIEATP